ncbi:MAG: response regulator [Nitrospinota bacterium]|nr:response regulator [Nitrospinota bacterium]
MLLKLGLPRERIRYLIVIMTIITFIVTAVSTGLLYTVSFEQQTTRLTETAQSQAKLIEAMFKHDEQHGHITQIETELHILGQMQEAHKNYQGFGKTGEFTFAKLKNGKIHFLLTHRHSGSFGTNEDHPPFPMTDNYAQPMQMALKGKSGSMIGLDYRGEKVLAAYEPVAWGDEQVGIVAKIDLSEIRAPFIKTGLITALIAILAVFAGAYVFREISDPLIQELNDSELRYRQLVELTPDGFLIHSDGRVVFANSAAKKMLGTDNPDRITETPIVNFVLPEFWENTINRIYKMAEQNKPITLIEETFVRTDGTILDVEVISMPILYKNKPALQMVLHDITIRKQHQKAILDRSREMQTIFDAIPDIYFRFKPDGTIIDFHASSYFKIDLKAAPCIGEKAETVFPEDMFAKVAPAISEVAQQKRVANIEFKMANQNGSRHFDSRLLPLPNGEVMCMLRDITDRKKSDMALQQVVVGISSAKSGAEFFSSLVLNLAGTLNISHALIGKICEDNMNRVKTIAICADGKLAENFEFDLEGTPCQTVINQRLCTYPSNVTRMFPKDKILIDMGIECYSGTPLFGSDGRSLGILVILDRNPMVNRVMTESMLEIFATRVAAELERCQYEEDIRKAKDDAVKATELKDKFLSLVSHDLKTPLSSINGSIQLLKRENTTLRSENLGKFIALAESAGKQMGNLIDEVLTISRFKTGKLKLNCSFFDPYFAVYKVQENVRTLAEAKNIILENKVIKNKRLFADSQLLTEILANLMTNAIKFTNPGGTVALSFDEDKMNTIVIEDNGIGISAKNLKKIFSFEEKTTTLGTSGEVGTGMGLPLCKEMVEAHGGNLKVESALNKGTRFYVSLPVVKPKILFVDDEDNFRILFRHHLQKLDLEFIEARNGLEALEILKSKTPHLIISDLSMPAMDGFALLENIKNNPRTNTIPTIIFTSDSSVETRNHVLQMGADDFLEKTSPPNEFIPRIRRYIG